MLNGAKNAVRESEMMKLAPDERDGGDGRAPADGVRHLHAAFAALKSDQDEATDEADKAIHCERDLEHCYRTAMSALTDVDDLKIVTGRRELYRRYSRIGEQPRAGRAPGLVLGGEGGLSSALGDVALQRGPGEQQALLARVAEPHDGLGLVAVADHVEDHALAELLVGDVVADVQAELLGAAAADRRPSRRRAPPDATAAATTASRCEPKPEPRRRAGDAARPAPATSSSGISARNRLGG